MAPEKEQERSEQPGADQDTKGQEQAQSQEQPPQRAGRQRGQESRGAQAEEPQRKPSPIEAPIRAALQDLGVNVEYSLDELVVRAPAEANVEVCQALKSTPGLDFTYLRCLAAVDYVEEMEVLYFLSSLTHPHKVVVKTRIAAANEPTLRSVTRVWRGADWHEREAHDLFGISFEGHPDMSPLLLFEGFEGFPLRKSYEIPEQQEHLGG